MSAPFAAQPLVEPGIVNRALGRKVRANLLAELNNLFASAARPSEVSEEAVSRIAESYGIDPARKCAAQLEAMYGSFLEHCLQDRQLSDSEVDDLAHLKRLFGLSDATVERVHEQKAGEIYGESVAEAVADGRLAAEERTFLEKLQSELRLPDEIARRITTARAQERLDAEISAAVQDRRLSPEEEAELYAIARSLGTIVEIDDQARLMLDHYRLYWLIENRELPEVSAGISLRRGEVCYGVCDVEWYQMRTNKKKPIRSGPSLRARIMEGVGWRPRAASSKRIADDQMKPIDSGRVFLTNTRLIFKGKTRNLSIPLKKIAGFTPYANGIEVQREAGRNTFLKLSADVDLFALTLERVLRDAE